MNDFSFLHLQSSLSKQHRLKSLRLELAGPKVSSIRISQLLDEQVQKLPLEEVSICFYNFVNLIDEVMKTILNSISSMARLRSLNLNLDKSSVSDASIQQFKSVLLELKDLERFSLRIGFTIGAISNKSLIAISQGLKATTDLQHFSLEFEKKPAITDDGVIALGEELREISRLKSLRLSFPGCNKLTSKSTAVLSQSISMMRFLQSLSLNFESNPEIDDDGIMPLVTYLKRLKKLDALRINLSKESFSAGVMELVRKLVRSIPNGEMY